MKTGRLHRVSRSSDDHSQGKLLDQRRAHESWQRDVFAISGWQKLPAFDPSHRLHTQLCTTVDRRRPLDKPCVNLFWEESGGKSGVAVEQE